jgi:hypothetical protein
MATKSKETTPPPHGNCIYPWDVWEDGQWHNARQGRDFAIPRKTFRSSLFSHAAERNLKAETRTKKGNLIDVWFRFLPKDKAK